MLDSGLSVLFTELSWKFTKSIKRIFLIILRIIYVDSEKLNCPFWKNIYFGVGKAPLRFSGIQAFVLIRIPVIKIPSVFISRLQFAF